MNILNQPAAANEIRNPSRDKLKSVPKDNDMKGEKPVIYKQHQKHFRFAKIQIKIHQKHKKKHFRFGETSRNGEKIPKMTAPSSGNFLQ